MEFVLKALEGIFSIVFIIGIGFVLSRRGWFDEYSSALIDRQAGNCCVIASLYDRQYQ